MAGQTAGRRRGRETVADMVRSLGLVLAIVVVVFLIARPPASTSQRVRVIDYSSDVAQARAAAPYGVLAPAGLSTRWRATSSRAEVPSAGTPGPVSLHIGFVTPADAYAAVAESNIEPTTFVADQTERAAPDGSEQVAGTTWERRRAEGGALSLVLSGAGRTVVVTGTAGLDELHELAAALR